MIRMPFIFHLFRAAHIRPLASCGRHVHRTLHWPSGDGWARSPNRDAPPPAVWHFSSKSAVSLPETPQHVPAASELRLQRYRLSCGGRVSLPGNVPSDRSAGQVIPEAGVGCCGTIKACAHGICSLPEARSGTEPEAALEARHRVAFSSKNSRSDRLKTGSRGSFRRACEMR